MKDLTVSLFALFLSNPSCLLLANLTFANDDSRPVLPPPHEPETIPQISNLHFSAWLLWNFIAWHPSPFAKLCLSLSVPILCFCPEQALPSFNHSLPMHLPRAVLGRSFQNRALSLPSGRHKAGWDLLSLCPCRAHGDASSTKPPNAFFPHYQLHVEVTLTRMAPEFTVKICAQEWWLFNKDKNLWKAWVIRFPSEFPVILEVLSSILNHSYLTVSSCTHFVKPYSPWL